jgi:hypothetical protein
MRKQLHQMDDARQALKGMRAKLESQGEYAVQAAVQRARGIPEVLSSIVMKLLAKTAEERYQTAAVPSATDGDALLLGERAINLVAQQRGQFDAQREQGRRHQIPRSRQIDRHDCLDAARARR